MKRSEAALLAFLILVLVVLIYYPHFDYPYPLHADEWKHISFTFMLKDGDVKNDLEMGFKLFLLPFSYLTDLVLVYRFFPALFAALSSLVLFHFLRRSFGIPEALLSIVFFASLRTNINILGTQLFVPLTFSIPFIYSYFFLLREWEERKDDRKLLAAVSLIVVLLFSHPISFTFAIPALSAYFILKKERGNKTLLKALVIVLAVFLILGAILLGQLNRLIAEGFIGKIDLANFIAWKQDPNVYQYKYFLPSLYGVIPVLFAFFGAFLLQKRKDYLFLLWPLSCFFSLWLFHNFGFSLLASYQRMVYYALLGLVPLSAIGASEAFRRARRFLEERVGKHAVPVASLLLILSLVPSFLPYEESGQLAIRKVITQEEYYALRHLSRFPVGVVIADKWTSSAVFPVSGHSIVADTFFFGTPEARTDLDRFFASDCGTKEEIIKKYKASYVLSRESLDCGWTEIYDSGVHVYSVQIPKPVIEDLGSHVEIKDGLFSLIAFRSPEPRNLKLAAVRKGLVLFFDGKELIEEGAGFGYPVIVTKGGNVILSNFSEDSVEGSTLKWVYHMDTEDIGKLPEAKYHTVPSMGNVTVIYDFSITGRIGVFADFSSLDFSTIEKIYVMNEQGFSFSVFQNRSSEVELQNSGYGLNDEQGTGSKVACLRDPSLGIRYCVSHDGRKLVGREAIENYTRWSGIEIPIYDSRKQLEYEIFYSV